MLYYMKDKIVFEVTYEDGHYTATASGNNYAIITDGENFEVLKKNIQEAVELHLQGENGLPSKSLSDVSLIASFEIPIIA